MKILSIAKLPFNTKVISGGQMSFILFFLITKIGLLLKRRINILTVPINKIFSLFTERGYVIKNKTGIFLVRPFDDSMTISSDYFEKDIRGWVKNSNRSYFIDIGANIGLYTIIAAQHNYEHIISYEANSLTAKTLSTNCKLNKIDHKVTIVPNALGSEQATKSFIQDKYHKGGSRVVTDTATPKNGDKKVIVNVETFDDEKERLQLQIDKIGFIKIDVEGFEKEVLFGMKNTLSLIPVGVLLMVEIADKNQTIIKKYLKDKNFKLIDTQNNDYLFIKQ